MASFLNPAIRQRIEQATRADSTMCWNCSSCDAECPVEIAMHQLFRSSVSFRTAASEAGTPECFTCGACSSACPLTGERSAFDPRVIFRMVNLGLAEELLISPSIRISRCRPRTLRNWLTGAG